LTASAYAEVAPRPSAGCKLVEVERGRRLERVIEVDGQRRTYILDVPDIVKPATPAPLLLDFHGFGHSGAGVWQVSGFRALAEKEGFITVYPQGLPVTLELRGKKWVNDGWDMFKTDGNRDLRLVTALLADLEAQYCIDQARVFATGFSNGAFFTSLLGCTMADKFAAVAPVAGGSLPIPCKPSRGVPVLIHHGRNDELIGVDRAHRGRDAWIEADGCKESLSNGCERHRECRDGATVEYCEGDQDHTWPAEATGRIWKFFTEHPLPVKQ
jgi:polyhydroxybutyrate depolymerase